MPLYVPGKKDFNFLYSNVSATRLVAGWGTSHTAAAVPNFSTYATLVTAANITTDIFWVELIFSNAFLAATTRNLLVNIGVDTAGGTSFTTLIPSLMAGHAGSMIVGGGITYNFPLYIPAGSSIGIQASGTTAFAFNTAIKLYGRPSSPDSINVGSYVVNYGTVAATATGAAVTLGTTAEGNYATVATTTRNHWWWQMGHTIVDTNIAAAGLSFDLAAGSSTTLNEQILQDQLFFYDGTERIWNTPQVNCYGNTNAGDIIYIRGQTSGTAETSPTVAAYGLGG